jgi:cytochrome c oxidase subunit 4
MTVFGQRVRNLLLAWAALVALMLTSLASAYVPLGPWNLVIGVAIATLKSLIVMALFMGLVRGAPLPRIVAAIGFATLALLFALGGLDDATRVVQPVAMQRPAQVHNASKGTSR